jgi:anti-sigma B factor antagonist
VGRPDALFETDARHMGDVVVLSLTGELDMASAPMLHRAVERTHDKGPIVIDLRDLSFIDSTGIRALIEVYSAGQNGHSTVSFIRAQLHVQRVLQMAGVEGLLAWADLSDEEATEAT